MLKESGEHSIPTPRETGGSPGGAARGARRTALGARWCRAVPFPSSPLSFRMEMALHSHSKGHGRIPHFTQPEMVDLPFPF